MSSKAKTTHKHAGEHTGHAVAKAKVSEPMPAADWVKQMIESLTDAQKRWIDMASEQNALVLKAITEGVNFYKSARARLAGYRQTEVCRTPVGGTR